MTIKTEISIAEFLDKMTILEIKLKRITDASRLENINKEHLILKKIWNSNKFNSTGIIELTEELRSVNEKLWVIEDKIREKEKTKTFDEEFIELARSVYITNDKRSEIKKKINLEAGSDLIEEKSYSDY